MQAILLSELLKQRQRQGLPPLAGFPAPTQPASPILQRISGPGTAPPPTPTSVSGPAGYNALTNNRPMMGEIPRPANIPTAWGAPMGFKRAAG